MFMQRPNLEKEMVVLEEFKKNMLPAFSQVPSIYEGRRLVCSVAIGSARFTEELYLKSNNQVL